jgi:AcrR family transcriptional regulator
MPVRTKTPLMAERMLDAAARLFGTQRFHEVRMDDIAAQAEVGKGTLYRYFSDKEELFLALVERSSQQLMTYLLAEVERADGPRAKLEAVAASIVEFFDERPHLFDLIQRAEVMTGPGVPWKETRNRNYELVKSLFEEGTVSGDFVVADPGLAAWLFLGGLRAVIRFDKTPRPRDLARRIVRSFTGNTPVRSMAGKTPASAL